MDSEVVGHEQHLADGKDHMEDTAETDSSGLFRLFKSKCKIKSTNDTEVQLSAKEDGTSMPSAPQATICSSSSGGRPLPEKSSATQPIPAYVALRF